MCWADWVNQLRERSFFALVKAEWRPADGFSRTLESICEGREDSGCTTKKFPVGVDHS